MAVGKKKREMWPIGIFFVYSLFVVLLLYKVVISEKNNIELVDKDYYQKGVEYQEQIERLRRTKDLAEKIGVKIDLDAKAVVVQSPSSWQSRKLSGSVNFFRPSKGSLDFKEPLQLDDQGVQTIPLAKLTAGYWKVQILWVLDDIEYFIEEGINVPES